MRSAIVWVCAAIGCGGEGVAPKAVVPTDYATTYREVRPCRRSLDHDIVRARILAAPEAFDAYNDRTAPFARDAIVLKEEFDIDDESCTGPITGFTIMQYLGAGADPALIDWRWEQANERLELVETDEVRCSMCHERCGIPPDGYQGTCSPP